MHIVEVERLLVDVPFHAIPERNMARQVSRGIVSDADMKQAAQKVYQDNLSRLGREAAARLILRSLYSPAQLQEQMVWFWFNHFNVHLYKSNIRVLVGDYQDNAIRPHAQCRLHAISSVDGASALDVGRAGLQADPVLLGQLQLGRVLNAEDPLVIRNEVAEHVEQRGLP